MRALSIDIETYGILEGQPLQTTFVPARSQHVDGVHPRHQILTTALTHGAAGRDIASWVPTQTSVYHPQLPNHLGMLISHLRAHDTLVGCNLIYDLAYLRAFSGALRDVLDGRHLLIDLTVLSFLENDVRPSHSLKAIARDYDIHRYLSSGKDRYRTLDEVDAYNATDTHVTLLCCAEAARRIALAQKSRPDDRLSDDCLRMYSDTIWSCLSMTEAGVPFSAQRLSDLLFEHSVSSTLAALKLQASHGLIVQGEGRDASRAAFLEKLIARTPGGDTASPQILQDPLFRETEKTGKPSWQKLNRALLRRYQPDTSLDPTLDLIDTHASSVKLITSYLNPLYGRASGKHPRGSELCGPRPIPGSPDQLLLSHPAWMIVPSAFKDSGFGGGTRQARITCTKPGHQTDPEPIQRCQRSRWAHGVLVSVDESQHELRTAGILSGEPAYISAYNAVPNHDLHGRRALSLWGSEILSRYPALAEIPVDSWKKHSPEFDRRERQVGKRGNFADLFRSGPDVIQLSIFNDIGEILPLETFEEMVRRRPVERPGLWEWQERLIKDAHSLGRITLPITGQTRTFLGGDDYDVNEIVNFPVQATAANTLLFIQIHLWRHLKGHPRIKMYLNVYDALKFDCASPRDVLELRDLITEAHAFVGSPSGYWGRVCELTGHSIPLGFDIKETPS